MADETPLTDRIDKWLWAVRIFKTRALATEACRAGFVEINQLPVKPSRDVRGGETISVRQGVVMRTLVVRGIPLQRVGASRVPEFCEDLTPASEFEKARVRSAVSVLARPKGSGRPTKRERRVLDQFLGDAEEPAPEES